MNLQDTLRHASCAILDDGVVNLGETTALLRIIRPFVEKGDSVAVELQGFLNHVRADGVITPDESRAVAEKLQQLSRGIMPEERRPLMTMPSATGHGYVLIEKILDDELGDKCGLYALVTIPAGCALGYHEHHGNGESYFILNGHGVYNDDGNLRTVGPGDSTWTPDGHGHGLDNSKGHGDLVFMALIVNA